jgi:multiple sugar transport system permease protein
MFHLHLIDTVFSLIIVYTAMNLPFATWLMTSFVGSVPKDIEDAAEIDGCSKFKLFYTITIPLLKPGIVATSIFCFIFAWNEFVFALILTRRVAMTLPIALGSLHATFGPEWGRICALALIVAFPVWILTLISQRYLVRGLTMGAIQ